MEISTTENKNDVNNISNETSLNDLINNKEKNESFQILNEKLNNIINNIKINFDFQISEEEKINKIEQVINTYYNYNYYFYSILMN